MEMVRFGRKFNIQTTEDYNNAMQILSDNEFVAQMSDDWNQAKRELDEIKRQRTDVQRQADERWGL